MLNSGLRIFKVCQAFATAMEQLGSIAKCAEPT